MGAGAPLLLTQTHAGMDPLLRTALSFLFTVQVTVQERCFQADSQFCSLTFCGPSTLSPSESLPAAPLPGPASAPATPLIPFAVAPMDLPRSPVGHLCT